MRGVFEDDEEELEQEKAGRDTELTLGAGTLILLLLGLALVCGVCFGLGYAMGHHSAMSQQASSDSQPASPAARSIPKPSAVPQSPPAASAPSPASAASTPAAADLPQATAAVTIPVNQASPASPNAPSPNPQMQVRPALPPMSPAPPPVAAPAAQPAQPAAMPANPLWVQIAAVSHAEDADVLSNALRRRGYMVTNRREPADNLIHVRIGPFATRDEAARWRLKLLNDGYNAMIQP